VKAIRVTQKDIAHACGLSVQAVSLALNRRRGVSDATAARVRAKAEAMGYAPDPVLASLVRFRQKAPPARGGDVMAYVHGFENAFWAPDSYLGRLEAGVREKASALGYGMERFSVGEMLPAKRLSQIFRARGIGAVVFAPQPYGRPLDMEGFAWEAFSVVGLGWSWHQSGLPTVVPSHFHSMRSAIGFLREAGCARIVFVLSADQNERDQHQYTGGFLSSFETEARDCIFIHNGESQARVMSWLKERKPDGLIFTGYPVTDWCFGYAKRAKPAPRIAHLDAASLGPHVPGIDQAPAAMGGLAADLAHSRAVGGMRGLSFPAMEVMVPGLWVG
jgi:LacI family transcriptional regulator